MAGGVALVSVELIKMSIFETINEGWIARRRPGENGRIGGPSCAVTGSGMLISSYITQSAMGRNDFVPHLARSQDGGVSWQDNGPIWPHLAETWSILVTVSRAPNDDLYLFGSRCRIDGPAETFWCETTQGLKENELIWSQSCDDGETWTEPAVIPMPVAGSAEAPSPMCVSRDNRWLCCYSPYHTFDATLQVDRSKAIVLVSDDRGQTWQHRHMLSYVKPETGTAVAAITQLADGRFLGAGWHLHLSDQEDYPNGFALSNDGWHWGPTHSTGIMGQAVGLAALPDGRVFMSYTQRKHGAVGIGIAIARPEPNDFGLEHNEIVWHAEQAQRHNSHGDHSEWLDFAFGMPVPTLLNADTLQLSFWLHQADGRGVRYLRLRWND